MGWVFGTLIDNPEIAILLVIGLGSLAGRLRWRTISLGGVTGTLLVGVAVGALVAVDTAEGTRTITVAGPVKAIFFLLFLYALGFKLGPQFVAGLRGNGLPQAAFAAILAVVAFAVTVVLAKVLGYNPGLAAGMASGGLTQSAIMGVAQGSIGQLSEDPQTLRTWTDLVPVAYAVTYIFGTVGTALHIAYVAPRILGIRNLPEAAGELEKKLGFEDANPDVRSAYQDVVRRAYRFNTLPDGVRTAADLEKLLDERNRHSERIYVARVDRGGQVIDAELGMELRSGDTIVLTSRAVGLFGAHISPLAEEVHDPELLDFPIEDLWVTVTNREVVGYTIADLRADPASRRIYLRGIRRAGNDVPFSSATRIDAGDQLHVQGPLPLLETAIRRLGYAERTTPDADLVTLGLGIAAGALIGIPTVMAGEIPIGLSTSVGALLAGLLLGWYRTRRPTWGKMPDALQWFLQTAGLNIFIAIVGLNSGPAFVSGLTEYGLSLFLAGAVVTILPLLIMTFAARYVFKFDPVLTLGILCGARSATAAVGATREAARSSVPLLGYSVPYAVANIVLTVGGAVVVALTA